MRRLNARKRVDSKRDKSSKMDPIKLQMRPVSRSILFSRNSKQTHKSKLLIFALVFLALAFLSCYFLVSSRSSRRPAKKRFGIVIDGGSTGTRIHVLGYAVEGANAAFDFGRDGLVSMRVNPGLSAYAEDPDSAGGTLNELIEFGKSRVPKEHWGDTEIRLMATAGLRILELNVQERILESCRRVLRSSAFKFRDEWASVISGSDEGIYAWVIANHALGTLGGDPLETTGIIELGGASVQVTFVSSEAIPPEFSRKVKYGNVTYNLYSHSFLRFGLNAAHDSVREALVSGEFASATKSLQKDTSIDPCTPKGYSHGENLQNSGATAGGNFSECRSAALMMLQNGKEKCSYENCYIGSTYTPKLRGRFLATENFFYTSKFFDLGSRAFLSNLVMAGQQFCGEDWPKLKKRYNPVDEDELLKYCFSSAYIVALLHDSLGISLDDQSVIVANSVGNIPLDWALGALILQSVAALDTEHSDWISAVIGNDMPTLLSLIAICILLPSAAWLISKWRKPQIKTIYDLEKGRYIVTRISR